MAEVTKHCECLEMQIKQLKEQLFVFLVGEILSSK